MSASVRSVLRAVTPDWARRAVREWRERGRLIGDHAVFDQAVRGQTCLEIGGPSPAFRCETRVYRSVARVDGVNFSQQTMWEGSIVPGQTYTYLRGRTGRQFVAEATVLPDIPDAAYDAVLSSNCLEHVANPLKALLEWKRILKPDGALILVLPRRESNFDHRRPFTTFQHLLDDHRNAVAEGDLTHLDEILQLHDLERDPWAGGYDNFARRCRDNAAIRGMHHHVFEPALIAQMLDFVGMEVAHIASTPGDYFTLAKAVPSLNSR